MKTYNFTPQTPEPEIRNAVNATIYITDSTMRTQMLNHIEAMTIKNLQKRN